MTRATGQLLILADGEAGLSALELALVRRGANVVCADPESAAPLLEGHEAHLILVDPARIDPAAAAALETSPLAPWLVALLAESSPATLARAMAAGARGFVVLPIAGDGGTQADRLLELARQKADADGQHPATLARAMRRLEQQARELTDRYVGQCRTFDEAQDVFYVDLGRMMTIFDNIMDGIVFTDPEGQVALMNPVAEHLIGVKTIFAIGKRVRDLGHGVELLEEVSADQERALLDGGVSERTLEAHHAGRDLSYLKLRTTAVTDYKGSFAGVLTVIKDVTLEFTSEQMKNRYLSIVAHELRTPLTGIKTFATLLANGTLGELPRAQREVTVSIREQALRLEHEVDKLVCLGRIESGDFARDKEPLPLADLLDSATAPFAQIARDRGIRFDVERSPASPWVVADREDLRRAIHALVENAIKFIPDGGRVRVFDEQAGGIVKLHVKDDGPGIDPRYHGRIFDKFFQVEDPLTRHHGGAGLGLNVARGVANALGGWIELVSDLGQGADFSICLPVHAEDRLHDAETGQGGVAVIRKEQ